MKIPLTKSSFHNVQNFQFDNEGKLTLSKRPVSLLTNADQSALRYILSIVQFSSYHLIVTSSGVYKFTISSLSVTDVTPGSFSVGVPETDAVNWQSKVYMTGQTDLRSYDGSSYSGALASVSLTDDKPHPLCVFENLNYLAVGNENTVKLVNTSHTVVSTLTIPADYDVTSIRYRQNNIHIGTKHKTYGEAKVFIWNGSGTAAQSAYGVKSNWIFSLEEFDSSIVCITNAGQILRFNGGGFDPIANFPVYYSQRVWHDGTNGFVAGKVLNRGMVADGSILYICLDGSVQNDPNSQNDYFLKNQPSGLWCFDPKVGLYPRSLSTGDKYQSVTVSGIDTASNILTLASSINATTGEPVFIKTVGSITGISANRTYYVIRISATTIKLALSEYDAQNGYAIDLGGSLAGSETLYMNYYRKVGDIASILPGAVCLVNGLSIPPHAFDTNILWGSASLSVTAVTDAIYSLCSFSVAQNTGSFEIQRLYSPNTKDTFRDIKIKYGGLYLDSDKIIIKAKNKDRLGIPTVINDTTTWIDSRVISIPIVYKSLYPIEVGDEIVIVNGSKAGYTTHVADKTPGDAGTTWRIGVTDAIGVAGETLIFYVSGYKKIYTITNDTATNDEGYAEVPLTELGSSPRIDIKVEIYGHETFIEDIEVNNTKDK